MKIDQYGFSATISYKKAEFAGTKKQRSWNSTSFGEKLFNSERALRRFFKDNRIDNLVLFSIDMEFHGVAIDTVIFENIYFTGKTRKGDVATKKDGITTAHVLGKINDDIGRVRRLAKGIVPDSPQRLRGMSYRAFYKTYEDNYWIQNRVSYYAVPAEIKKNRTKFQKSGPKPNIGIIDELDSYGGDLVSLY